MKNVVLSILLLFSLFFSAPAVPCSTVGAFTPGAFFVGKNYDWLQTLGRVYVNKRNMLKSSLVVRPIDRPAEWTSKYGSVTFNQYGREFPNGGMNEAGLMVEIMWLEGSVYPPNDSRPTVNELQWIQYMLDLYDNVDDMVRDSDSLRVSMVSAPVHYMACDYTGACATFEYVGGRLISHSAARLPHNSLTNDTYADSLLFLQKHQGFGGSLPIPGDKSSLSRFVRGTSLARNINGSDVRGQIFNVLLAVAQPTTVWQMAYDLSEGVAHFRTSNNREIKSIDLKTLDFRCAEPVKTSNLQVATGGLLNPRFTDYLELENYLLVSEAITTSPVPIPDKVKQQLIGAVTQYPNTTRCTE